MSKFLIGAVVVIAAIAAGIGAAALAGPRIGQYMQARVSTSSRQFRSPNQMPFPGFPGARRPGNRPGAPGYHGINSQSSGQSQNALAPLASYSQWNDSNSKIAGSPDFSSLNGGQ